MAVGAQQLSRRPRLAAAAGYWRRIEDLGPELTDWSQTAAAMMEPDLIIVVAAAVAHLAGAFG